MSRKHVEDKIIEFAFVGSVVIKVKTTIGIKVVGYWKWQEQIYIEWNDN